MMRLFVTVWKLTVAMAWQKATTSMTSTLLARICAISQKPRDPGGIGLSQASRPKPKPRDKTMRMDSTIQ